MNPSVSGFTLLRPGGGGNGLLISVMLWFASGAIDKACYFRVVPGLGDYNATVRVPNENHRAVFGSDGTLGRGNIICKRSERGSDGRDMEALRLKQRDNL